MKSGTSLVVGGGIGFVIGIALICASCALGCGGPQPTPEQQLDVGAFSAELANCVASSSTRASYESCRSAVTARYGVDGGGAR